MTFKKEIQSLYCFPNSNMVSKRDTCNKEVLIGLQFLRTKGRKDIHECNSNNSSVLEERKVQLRIPRRNTHLTTAVLLLGHPSPEHLAENALRC